MNSSILVMGYDVERYMSPEDRMSSLQGVKKIIALHRAYHAPFTFFMLGKLLEYDDYVAELKKELALAGDLADIQQHTYSHPLLKVNERYMREKNRKPLSVSEIDAEIKKANHIIESKLGVKVFGLKTPIGFHKGLQGEKAILDVLKKNGMRFVSSDLVGKGDHPPALLEEDGKLRQHYVYENGLTEVPTHGWHDTHILLKNMSPYKGVKEACAYYQNELSKAHNKGMMYAPNLHPFIYSDRDHDPQASIVETFLSFAKANKIPVMSYAGYVEHIQKKSNP
ncbi:MAG: polysaccharide deacetylase family protein [Nanoarchaeota archaeon]|nr:polysaccharide deacetylase family protein [Nanoarchaeota archaeon]